jgi:hypothetical protein
MAEKEELTAKELRERFRASQGKQPQSQTGIPGAKALIKWLADAKSACTEWSADERDAYMLNIDEVSQAISELNGVLTKNATTSKAQDGTSAKNKQ